MIGRSPRATATLLSLMTLAGGAAAGATGVQAAVDGDLPQGGEPVDLDPATFTVDIDNPYWPMVPGTRWTYAETDEEGQVLDVVVTVTSETKQIANGITARVVRDTVRRGDEVVEDTFDWYAQDEAGNIWYLGEDTAEFEGGQVTSTAGSFEAGVDGAQPGIIMPADPTAGVRYRQEYYAGEAEDNGEDPEHRRAGRGPVRTLRRRHPHEGHDHDRARRPRVQALCTRCRPGPGARRLGRRRSRRARRRRDGQRASRQGGRYEGPRRVVPLSRRSVRHVPLGAAGAVVSRAFRARP